ncbi:MAG: amino acid ABC transporter substrate-binding protein [Geminicoccaceae bacterium]
MRHWQRQAWLAGIMVIAAAGPLAAQTLERIESTQTFKLGYREDAKPFSFADANGEPAGYSVDLCREVANEAASQLGIDQLAIEYVAVTAENRFDALADGTIDLLCGATTETLARREIVDFSLLTFVTGASILYRTDGPSRFEDLAGQTVGALAGTTTGASLEDAFAEIDINVAVERFASHEEGLAALEAGEVSAYFGDRALLIGLMQQANDPAMFRVSERFFSYEPYALALQHGDNAFRLLVDSTLSRLYASGEIIEIYQSAFGDVPASDLLQAMFIMQSLPE